MGESLHDGALVFGVLQRLQENQQPLSPRSLGKLLPIAQRLAQSNCEDHAVGAMRFVLHALKFSWPQIVKALRSVATPKGTWDACEEATARLSAFSTMVKAMAQSVRVSRTNGPLMPVC